MDAVCVRLEFWGCGWIFWEVGGGGREGGREGEAVDGDGDGNGKRVERGEMRGGRMRRASRVGFAGYASLFCILGGFRTSPGDGEGPSRDHGERYEIVA